MNMYQNFGPEGGVDPSNYDGIRENREVPEPETVEPVGLDLNQEPVNDSEDSLDTKKARLDDLKHARNEAYENNNHSRAKELNDAIREQVEEEFVNSQRDNNPETKFHAFIKAEYTSECNGFEAQLRKVA